MAGIYIHIPFCKSRCIYCGFYSTTMHNLHDRYADAIIKEYDLRRDYHAGQSIDTIYLGGGTPSVMPMESLSRIMQSLPLPDNREVTMECNPDDITPEFASSIRQLGINRVSMGAQTFSPSRLRFLNRRHSPEQVSEAVELLRKEGIANISIDLMFGFPAETLQDWCSDIDKATALNVDHISAYSLMYEEGTPLCRMLEDGKIKEIDEELSRKMYYTLIDKLADAGFEQYEISNFCRPGMQSKHNSSYWNDTPYIGLGAGAHSYNRTSRQWNVEDLPLYINKVENGEVPFEQEIIDEVTRYNDMITTALRTRQGIDITRAGCRQTYLLAYAQPLIEKGLLSFDGQYLSLTREGLYVSNDIMSELIYID